MSRTFFVARATGLHLSLALALALAAGCKKDEASPKASADAGGAPEIASTPSPRPAPDAGAAATSTTASHEKVTPVFHGFFGKPASGPSFWLGLERRGDSVRAIYRAQSSTELVGKMTDATHFSLHESHVPKGEKPATIVGELASDSALVATLTDGKTRKKTVLTSRGDVFDGQARDFKQEYTGSLGGRFVRMKLTKVGEKVTGVYRYAKSAEDIHLEGTVKDKTGAFEMNEKVGARITGRFTGVFVSRENMLAEWSSPDGERTFRVKMEQGDGYPETVDLGGGLALYPQENVIEGKRCKYDLVFPQLRGAKDGAKQSALNALLRGDQGKTRTCEGPDEPEIMDYEETESYTLGTHKQGRFVGLSQGGYSFMGGAHGNGGIECSVIDTRNLTRMRLAELLTEEGKKKLGELTTHALQKQLGVQKLTDSYFYADDVEVQKTTNLCLSDTSIEVSFNQYEIAPYVAGPQSVTFPKAEMRELFEKNELTQALFTE
jgi:hypothetical protein